ncbi:membrane-targeted effector domain-containing toxin [Pseudomonas orientalis]|uniref:membrane-targeted effector domain-containing toxin n=1 Tax=Pseudomonas orientalis TaxID=76758 RepID=UPI00320A20D5
MQTPTPAHVAGIRPVGAIRTDLLSGLQITDQRLLLNQYQVLSQKIQALMDRQPTLDNQTPSSIARFWTEPRADADNLESAQDELLATHREMLSTLAALRVEDGTLTPAAKALIDTAIEHPTLAARESAMKDGERPGVYPLRLDTPKPNGTVLAGAFIITGSDGSSAQRRFDTADADRTLQPSEQQGLAVLYTPREGYEVFNSPGTALETLRQRIGDEPDSARQLMQSLPLTVEKSLPRDWKHQLSQTLVPVADDVIATGLPQLLERQQDQAQGVRRISEPQRLAQSVDNLAPTSELAAHFDGTDALWARTQLLLDQLDQASGSEVFARQLENRKNWEYLAQKLNDAVEKLAENPSAREVSACLKQLPMNVSPGSAHYLPYILEPGKSVSLETFIGDNGFAIPTTRAALLSLAHTASARARQHPFGNVGGALSWPIPLSVEDQPTLRAAAIEHLRRTNDEPESPTLGVLDGLMRRQPLSVETLEDPVKTLETLVNSPGGQALGLAMQTEMNGIATETSVNDYTLAAINLALDPESITAPRRNRLAGFDLAQKSHWFQPPSTIVAALRQHLIDEQIISPALANTAEYVMLLRTAPQFLVKDIPAHVLYGSQAWANLCIATAAIEALAQGLAATMTFAEVMIMASTLNPAPAAAQAAAWVDWAVANNILEAKDDALYSQDEISRAQAAFTHQQAKLQEASALLDTPVPSREQMARELVKKTFGQTAAVDEKIYSRLSNSLPPKPGKPYSLLEIVMEGVVMDGRWGVKKGASGVDIDTLVAFTKSPDFNIPQAFDAAFANATVQHKTVKKISLLNALTQLPPEDKKNLSTGKLKYYQEKSYRVRRLPFIDPTLFHTSPKILVTAENGGKIAKYEFDTEKGVIHNIGDRPVPRAPEYVADEVSKVEEFFPDIDKGKVVDGLQTFVSYLPVNPLLAWVDTDSYKRDSLDEEQPGTASAPYMFTSPRSHHIAESMLAALDLDNPARRKAAAGTTSAERRAEQTGTLRNTFLDLIPLRSAIVNFSDANYSEGINDVAFDMFGFITAGVGAAAKAGKVLGTTASTVSKALKVTKIMIPPLLKELNPFNGACDLFLGAGKLAYEGASAARDGLRTLRGTADQPALVAASTRYDAAATGAANVAGTTVNASAVKHNEQWYAFDANRMQPYGPPLDDFRPTHTLMPPSPDMRYASKARTEAYRNGRVQPYKKTGHAPLSQRPINGVIAPAQAAAHKTDHLPPVTQEYVDYIKGAPSEAHFTPSRRHVTKDRFELEMHKGLAAPELPRPVLPEMKPYEPINELVENALDSADIVAFGENHRSLASFRVLIDLIPVFKRKNVKVFGVEGMVYDNKMRLKDDGMGTTGSNHRPHDPGLNLQTLIDTFKANGIEVVPLDHFYLTRHRHERSAYTSLSPADRNVRRLKEMNYYAARELLRHTHKGKVVALVGRQHINTTQGIKGLAEATGGLGIGVYERAGMKVGYGTRSTDARPGPQGTMTSHNDITGDLQIFAPE